MTEASVADIISDWTKIPVQRLTEGETKRLARLEKELHKRVIGTGRSSKAVAQQSNEAVSVSKIQTARSVPSFSLDLPV